MSAKLPDGSIISLGTAFGSALTVSAITNASPAVCTSTAHGLTNGDYVILTSGWSNANGRIFRVTASTTNAFSLEGFDTTSTTLFPAGSGAGTAMKVTTFTQISQIMNMTTSGGDQQFANYSFLEQNFETQIPTITSAQSIALDIADDPTLAGYSAIKTASDARAIRPLQIVLPDSSRILYYGYVSFNETPSLNKGQVMVVKATFNLVNKPVRYST